MDHHLFNDPLWLGSYAMYHCFTVVYTIQMNICVAKTMIVSLVEIPPGGMVAGNVLTASVRGHLLSHCSPARCPVRSQRVDPQAHFNTCRPPQSMLTLIILFRFAGFIGRHAMSLF